MPDDEHGQQGIRLTDLRGRTLGALLLNADAITEHYAEYHRLTIGRGEPLGATAISALMPSVLQWLAGRLGAHDISDALDNALRNQVPSVPTEHDQVHADLLAHEHTRRRSGVGLAGMRLQTMLELPADQVFPDRPRLRQEEGLIGRNLSILQMSERVPADRPPAQSPLSVAEFMAAAILEGDSEALGAIQRWMRQFVDRGPKRQDWAHILQDYGQTRAAVKDLASRLKDAAEDEAEVEYSHLEIVRRIARAGLGDELKRRPVRAVYLAKAVVAKEHRVTTKTLNERWKQRSAYGNDSTAI